MAFCQRGSPVIQQALIKLKIDFRFDPLNQGG
ncbi:hypothetical protein NIES298_11800 [Microcystis aeruginosa NIES-298]|nr:hypothetical protein NIES298_11800 [Microcystis aeruginosa NIES-298]